jgi:hypothetical protein
MKSAMPRGHFTIMERVPEMDKRDATGPGRLKQMLSSGLVLLCLVVAVPAAATLGEDVSSVRADQAQTQGTLQIASAAKFTVHEIQMPSGTVVKQYVSPAGMVFAVSWQGPTLPDLQQVLGRYFEQYAEAIRTRGSGSGPRLNQQPGLVVQSGGHMRAFFGRAYVQQMLPRGVLAEEIQ